MLEWGPLAFTDVGDSAQGRLPESEPRSLKFSVTALHL